MTQTPYVISLIVAAVGFGAAVGSTQPWLALAGLAALIIGGIVIVRHLDRQAIGKDR